ncbi:hypothetical protein [Accumulibacter sp.]|uniref:hypothetical protein n=1 Tax=Accumulibacter sp. TaxID=2053492 RepID=UPI0025F76C8A|nr:hypothetical protein [Accumulibacter sp.]
MEEDEMSEFTRTCEQFLATARQHFFAADGRTTTHPRSAEETAEGACGEAVHGIPACG